MPDHPILEPGTGSPRPATGRLPIARPAARTSAAAERDAATTRSALLSPRSLQLCLGFVWLFVGALQLQPFMFGHGFVTKVILPNTMGQPAAVAAPITLAAHVMTHYPVLLNSLFAGAQILIGVSMIRLALLNRSTVRLVLLVSMAWALSVWWIGEGLGGLLTGAASPLTGAPGAVILYAVLAVLAWPPRKVATASPMEAGRPGIVSPQVPAAPARGEGVFGRVIWIVLWVGSAAMLLAPANRTAQSIRNQIVGSAAGEPGWLASFQRSVAAAAAGHGEIIAVVLAVASLAIGIGVFVPRIRTAALVFGALLSLAYWVVGQAFGGILTGTGTDPNAGALFVLLALALAPGGLRLPSIASLRARIRGVVSERSPARTGAGASTAPTS